MYKYVRIQMEDMQLYHLVIMVAAQVRLRPASGFHSQMQSTKQQLDLTYCTLHKYQRGQHREKQMNWVLRKENSDEANKTLSVWARTRKGTGTIWGLRGGRGLQEAGGGEQHQPHPHLEIPILQDTW